LFLALFNTQQETAKAQFMHIGSKYKSLFENKINNTLDYLFIVEGLLEFNLNEGAADRVTLQKTLYSIFENYPDIDTAIIHFEPNMYDGKDASFIGTQYGKNSDGSICFTFFKENGISHFLNEPLDHNTQGIKANHERAKDVNAPFYTSPVIYETEDGKKTPIFSIVFPLHDNNGRFMGAVTAGVLLDEIYSLIEAEEIYKTGYMMVTNEENEIVYSPTLENIGKTLFEAGFTTPFPQRFTETIIRSFRSPVTGKDILLMVGTIYFPRMDSWFYIAASAPLNEIYSGGNRLLALTIVFSIVIMVVIALLLNYLIGVIMKPIKAFIDSAAQIAKGDYKGRITGDYKDEFGVLKDTANLMMDRIETFMNESTNSLLVLENILNGIDAFLYATVPDTGKLIFVNEKMKKAFGLDDSCIGQYCYKVFRGFDTMCKFCPCAELDKNPEKIISWEEYDENLKRDIRHTDLYIDWPDGNKVHLQYVIDITDIKRLTEEKLKAEETSRMKSAFLANMSHEIRTPMHGIIGFSELALDDEIPLKTRNYISKIKTSAESLLQIINDILDVSKIESGKLELEMIPFNISEVFKLCRVIVSPKAHEKGITLYCYAEPSIGRMLIGDPTKLRQILLNLLSNAIKFTNTGIVKLLSAITAYEENSITMRFEVKDSGIGMTADQIERVFQPFEQGDDSTKRKYGGTGLGLTITKNFIEAMGGKLIVESNPGIGSRFYFELKFETMNIEEDKALKAVISNVDEKPVFEGEVLVCEDNILNQQVICDHLARVGLKTIVAQNGKIGVDIIKKRIENKDKPFDLIFMDIHMPEMDGLEAASKIIQAGCTTPIIALTANIMTNDKEAYLQSGMKECMPKPFIANELWACLLKFLEPVSIVSGKTENEFAEEETEHLEIITTFVKSNQNTFKEISDALAVSDIKLAHRLVHTLKGVAGLVGMTMLAEAAFSLEQSLASGDVEFLNEKINTLEYELNSALNELTPIMNDYIAKTQQISNEVLDKASALKILEKLDGLLEKNSFDSLNLISELRKINGTKQLIEEVENFNFKPARETLFIIKQHLENNNE
jgi:signal transduction histidine kinase/DNA-binding response OmpR family regulator/HAMP domain-containing protein